MTQPVFRFAPSPNGLLHLGHAYSALLNASLAERWQGRFLLRIEDIDPTRSRPDFEAAIYEDLAWLGLTWEQPVRRQSEHIDDYRAAFRRLEPGHELLLQSGVRQGKAGNAGKTKFTTIGCAAGCPGIALAGVYRRTAPEGLARSSPPVRAAITSPL